jgi:hypothetical protein
MNEIAFNNIFSGNIRQVFLTCREIRISGYHLLRYKTVNNVQPRWPEQASLLRSVIMIDPTEISLPIASIGEHSNALFAVFLLKNCILRVF